MKLQINLSMLINKGRNIHEINKHLEFANLEEFASFKKSFYSTVIAKGWQRDRMSANQCHKGNLILTPYFIKE